MSSTNAFHPEYFSPVFQEIIDPYQALLEQYSDPNVSAFQQTWQLPSVLQAGATAQRRIDNEAGKVKDPYTSNVRLDEMFQAIAGGVVANDITFRLMTDNVARFTAAAKIKDPEQQLDSGFELGEEFIIYRASHNASAILRASDELFQIYEDTGQDNSVWDRAMAINDTHRLNNPRILDAAWEELMDLKDQAVALPADASEQSDVRLPRTKLGTIVRALRLTRKLAKTTDYSMFSLEGSVELYRGILREKVARSALPQLELNEAAITRAVSTTSKMMKYVKNASRVDPTIAAEPTARFAVYLTERLSGGTSVNTEKLAFAANVATILKTHEHATGISP